MKTNLLLIAAFAIFFSKTSLAQEADINLLTNDLLIIADNFASPAAEGAAFQSSSGWFTSAQELGKWKIDFSVQGNALFVPSNKKQKLISNSDFSILNVSTGSNALVPTAYGGTTDVQYTGEVNFANTTIPVELDAIDGINRGALIHPFVQLAVGLPYGTDFAVRYLPQITIDDVEFGTFGAGLKHNLTQYFNKHPHDDDFQFAVVATYTNFKVNYAFLPINVEQIVMLNRVNVDANLWLGQVLGSKRYDDFEVFAGLGVVNSDFSYSMGGEGIGLSLVNVGLKDFGKTQAKFKGDLGFNYYIGDSFKVSTMLTASSFFNANLGLHYQF